MGAPKVPEKQNPGEKREKPEDRRSVLALIGRWQSPALDRRKSTAWDPRAPPKEALFISQGSSAKPPGARPRAAALSGESRELRKAP